MIDGLSVVRRIIAMMPPGSMESVTLGSRGAVETGYTNVTYDNTQRFPSTGVMMTMDGSSVGEDTITFILYQTTEGTTPKIGDKITDASSIVWQVKRVEKKMQGKVHKCFCLKNKG